MKVYLDYKNLLNALKSKQLLQYLPVTDNEQKKA